MPRQGSSWSIRLLVALGAMQSAHSGSCIPMLPTSLSICMCCHDDQAVASRHRPWRRPTNFHGKEARVLTLWHVLRKRLRTYPCISPQSWLMWAQVSHFGGRKWQWCRVGTALLNWLCNALFPPSSLKRPRPSVFSWRINPFNVAGKGEESGPCKKDSHMCFVLNNMRYLFLLGEQACYLACGYNLKVLQMVPVFQPTSLVRKNTECQIDSTCFSVGLLCALGVQEVARKTGNQLSH